MGIIAFTVLWVVQDLYHQPYSSYAASGRKPVEGSGLGISKAFGFRAFKVEGFGFRVKVEGLGFRV